MKKFLILAIILLASISAFAQSHEYSPLKEYELKYKDWTYKSVLDDKDVNLRAAIKGKKLVMVVYFAAWCPNWRNQAPFTEKLYKKYKDKGFEVIGVSEYDLLSNVKNNLAQFEISFPVVVESESRAMKEKTVHYGYRKETGDTRNWGSPWNIFIEPDKTKKDGDVLTARAGVVNGELIEAEVEAFIRQKLGLPAEDAKTAAATAATVGAQNKAPETCTDAPAPIVLTKPKP